MPRIDDPKILRKTRRKPKYTPPASRSDAAQRSGATTKRPPGTDLVLKIQKPLEKLNNAAARDKIRAQANKSGPPTPIERAPEKHDADLTLGKSGRKERRKQRKITEQAIKDLFKARSQRRQSRGREALEGQGYLPKIEMPKRPEVKKIEWRTSTPGGTSGKKYPYVDGKRVYLKDGKVLDKRPISALERAAGRVPGSAIKFLTKRPDSEKQLNRAGFLPEAPNRAISKGAIAGGKSALGALGSALDRPSAAVEAHIGKSLVELGVIKDDAPGSTGKRIRRARGPVEAFIKGRRHDKDVTGGTIAKGVGLPKQLGLPIDLATDPLMYLGVGALPKAAAQRAAALSKRIEQAGPEAAAALRSEKLAAASGRARKTGDSDTLLNALREVADEQGVSTRALGRTKAERQAKRQTIKDQRAERAAESRQILEDVRAGSAGQIGEVGGRGRRKSTGTYVPDVSGQKAVESIARLAKQKEIRPGARVRLLLPTGREVGSVPIPVPGGLKVPSFVGKRGKKALAIQRIQEERYPEARIHRAALDEIQAQRKTQRAVNNPEALKALDDMEKNLQESMAKRTTAARDRVKESLDTGSTMQSLDEIAERFNRRRMMRTVAPAANQFGRMAQQQFHGKIMKSIEDNLGPHTAKGRTDQIAKIQLHRWARSDTGSQSILKKAGIKLTPAEQQVMKELDSLDQQMARFGQGVGTLNRALEDYGGFRMWENAEDVDQTIRNMSARMGGGGSFSKHRGFAAVSDLADPDRLAAEIKKASAKDLTDEQARAFADEWHNTGSVRLGQELMARSNQRGLDTLKLDDLPGSYVRAAKLGERRDVPLFDTDAPMAPGVVRLSRSEQAKREYDLPEIEPGELELTAALRSATADRDRLRHVLRTTKSGTKTWRGHKKYIQRLDNEINALQRELADRETIGAGDDVTDMAEKLTQMRLTEEALYREALDHPDDEAIIQALNAVHAKIARLEDDMNRRATGSEEFELEDMGRVDEDGVGHDFSDVPGQSADLDAEISRILDDPTSGNPFDFMKDDVTSRLPDFRRANEFPVLDMRKSYFYRTRSEAVNAAFRTRWRAIDAAEGRSVDEAEAAYKAADGTEGRVSDLVRMEFKRPDDRRQRSDEWPDDAEVERRLNTPEESKHIWEQMKDFHETEPPVAWYDQRLDKMYNEGELAQSPPALVPNKDRSVFWDLHTGREYVFPHAIANQEVGKSITNVIQPLNPNTGVPNFRRVWPTDTLHAADIEALRGGDYDIVFKTGMESGLGKALSMSRYSVTSLFPAYHTRNMISDLLKSMQADTGVMFHPIANAKLAAMAFGKNKGRTITIEGLGTMKGEDFLLMADAFGLRSGHHVAEVSRLADTGKFPERGVAGKTARALGPSGAIGKKAVDLGIAREDVTRFMTFAQRMRANGGDAADAMLHMVRHHFDYNDLTVNERRVVRNLFLFYTWYRKNIPLQLMEIAHRPGFFAGVAHSYNALEQGETPVNLDYSKFNPMFPDLSGRMPRRGTIPDYLKDRLSSVGMNWNGHAAMFGFGAPWSDLALLKASPEGMRDFAAMMNPVFTTGYQLAAEEDMLTGRDFYESEASGASSAIDAVIDALGIGELPKDDKGRPVLPWAATVALRNVVPGLGRSFGVFEASPTTRDIGRAQTLGKRLNALHGINVYVAPKPNSKREELAIQNRVTGRAIERRDYLGKISNRKPEDVERLTKLFDAETLKWMKERDIPKKYLYTTQQSGFYRRKPRSRGGSGLGEGGALGGSLTGGGGLGD